MCLFQNPAAAEVTRLKLNNGCQSFLTSAATVGKKTFNSLTLALVAGLFAANLRAEDLPAPIQKGADASADHSTWFSFGPQFGLNLNARFNYLGNLNSASPGPATGGGVNRIYDDGFVRVDSSGDAGGQTWNWGYQPGAQLQGGTLILHGSSSPVISTLSQNDDPNPGFDLAFGRRFGKAPGGQWGLQGAFDFTTLSIHNNQPLVSMGTFISDAYSLGGVIPPNAPYAGSFNGPGPLLGDTPTRTTTPEMVFISGQRTLDAQVYVLRGGPYYEFSFGNRWSGRLGGGLALAVADTKYSFNSVNITTSAGGVQTAYNVGSSEGAEFQAGGYLEGKLLYAMTVRTSLFAGAQYECLGTFSRNAGNEQAQLDMSNSVYVLFGVQLSF
jgi:hypothetical protein